MAITAHSSNATKNDLTGKKKKVIFGGEIPLQAMRSHSAHQIKFIHRKQVPGSAAPLPAASWSASWPPESIPAGRRRGSAGPRNSARSRQVSGSLAAASSTREGRQRAPRRKNPPSSSGPPVPIYEEEGGGEPREVVCVAALP